MFVNFKILNNYLRFIIQKLLRLADEGGICSMGHVRHLRVKRDLGIPSNAVLLGW